MTRGNMAPEKETSQAKAPKNTTLKAMYIEGGDRLRQAGVTEPELDAWYLLEYVTGVGRASYYADPGRVMTEEQRRRYEYCLEKRSRRIPLQHITGEQEFMGLKFHVNRHVLIPRQDTETLVEQALNILKKERPRRILDMCTGSGCILLSALHYAGYPVSGTGADLSENALAVARENAQSLGIRAEFLRGDLFENVSGKFGMILSNPP